MTSRSFPAGLLWHNRLYFSSTHSILYVRTLVILELKWSFGHRVGFVLEALKNEVEGEGTVALGLGEKFRFGPLGPRISKMLAFLTLPLSRASLIGMYFSVNSSQGSARAGRRRTARKCDLQNSHPRQADSRWGI
jgi:hypothetical protein